MSSAAAPLVLSVRRRQGAVAGLVLEALKEADGPLGAAAVVARIRELHGDLISHATVMSVLRQGREARTGRILQVGPGLYEVKERR